jgi:hypothetical protein
VDDQRLGQLLRELGPNEAIVTYAPGEHWRLTQRIVILDAQGHERLDRNLPAFHNLVAADLDGDDHAELLFQTFDRLRATGRNLQDLWSWPTPFAPRQILPARQGKPATVVLNSMIGLDGATGRARWSGGSSTIILDPGDATTLPRLLGGPEGTTACRVAVPTSVEGMILQARGEPAQPVPTGDDPRWERTLPWATAIPSNPQPRTYLLVAWLALLSVVVPLATLRLATRRPISSLRLVIALPAAAAIPVAGFLYRLGSWTLPLDDPSTWAAAGTFALTSLAGLPILFYLTAAASILVRRHWRRLLLLLALTVIASVLLGGIWLGWDSHRMRDVEREHYNWSDWYEAVLPGVYAVGVLALVAWAVRRLIRFAVWLERWTAALAAGLSSRR